MIENATAQVELRVLRDIARVLAGAGDLATILQAVAEAIAAGRDNRDVYVYTYDQDANELVLTGATESPAARQVGTLRVAYGDGVTGWVAASRQSYLVAEEPAGDPHFLAYPGIGEERYGAIFSVPIVSRHDDLLGCVTVWATNGHRFDPAEVPFVERVAALVAGVFETERLANVAEMQTRIASGTAELASMLASGTAASSAVEFAVDLARVAVNADLAVVVATDETGSDRMFLKAASVGAGHPMHSSIDSVRRELLAVEQEIRTARVNWRAAMEAMAHAVDGRVGAVVTAPVRAGATELGFMVCYRIGPARFTTVDATTLASFANHAAVALKLALSSDGSSERGGVNWFLRDLSSGHLGGDQLRRRAVAVGLDAAGGYVFVVGSAATRPLPGVPVAAAPAGPSLRDLLASSPAVPGSTHYATTAHQTVAIVPWSGSEGFVDDLRLALLSLCSRVRTSAGVPLTFGISRPVKAVDEFAGALAEAREAMAIGATLDNPSGVFTLDDVGQHLLLSRVSSVASVRDRYTTAIARIAEYDRVKGTELLETVSVFLHFRSQSASARELFVHRNTLTQRLARASRLCGFDVSESAEWFPLQLALKVHQTRRGAEAAERSEVALPGPAAEAR
ncbi:helix-turn-helix domain-containing protein [Mycobacterium sp. MS1601]|uniref:helix-turn-helix domain-containing protein n=1 Tax=Mycobacterium sp. MS1601 TaxID=1936029 RepID=UPI0009F86AE6|nr:GAF domain-containing protein [Mycobacterium sp. MS1601]